MRFRYSPASVWMRMDKWLMVALWMTPTSSPLARSAEYVRCRGEGSFVGAAVGAGGAEVAADSADGAGMASMLLSLPPLLLVPVLLLLLLPLLALLPLRSTPPAEVSLT